MRYSGDMNEHTEQRGGRLQWMETPTDAEIDAAVRAMPDERLAENYRHAAKHPGTEWHRLLSAEIGRRDGGGK